MLSLLLDTPWDFKGFLTWSLSWASVPEGSSGGFSFFHQFTFLSPRDPGSYLEFTTQWEHISFSKMLFNSERWFRVFAQTEAYSSTGGASLQ